MGCSVGFGLVGVEVESVGCSVGFVLVGLEVEIGYVVVAMFVECGGSIGGLGLVGLKWISAVVFVESGNALVGIVGVPPSTSLLILISDLLKSFMSSVSLSFS